MGNRCHHEIDTIDVHLRPRKSELPEKACNTTGTAEALFSGPGEAMLGHGPVVQTTLREDLIVSVSRRQVIFDEYQPG